jgi:class 3 adenylate cyclase
LAENGIDLSILRHLTDQDLKDIGVLLGHRRKMLAAISELAGAASAMPQPPTVTAPTPQDTAERRHLTVMFCDLVGSTALSARLDPEDLRGIISAYHRCCMELVERNGGFIAKFMGDGVLAYFGYPRAHEHDAERAVRAGLALAEAVPKLATQAGSPLQVRIGIGTGLVVVGDLIGAGAAQEQAVALFGVPRFRPPVFFLRAIFLLFYFCPKVDLARAIQCGFRSRLVPPARVPVEGIGGPIRLPPGPLSPPVLRPRTDRYRGCKPLKPTRRANSGH